MSTLPLVFSVTSGKGGVGKTNIAVNLALCLVKAGKRVLLLDADLGLANVDVLLGLTPQKNLFHLFHEGVKLSEILFPTPYGFAILPASSGVSEMLALNTGQKLELLEAVDDLENAVDCMIVDTGAGISDNVLYFNLAAQHRLVVLTQEPTSLTDAYALIKVLKQNHGVEHFKILVNMAPDVRAAKDVFLRLHTACDHFLSGVSMDFVGSIPRDPAMRAAVVDQRPICHTAVGGPACKALREISETVQTWDVPENLDGNIKFFWKKLLFLN
ncbi:MAG: MinD/ParA family protein [Deltaproteobacteria bacterium]|jgi:flagellar biosynthesis protein FlhG|nr:MinD/ParA family protein [Deltaproteobacteria bacterium]